MKQKQSWLTMAAIFSSVLLAGCQASGVVYKRHTEMYPPAGLELSAEIGEAVLERTRGIGSPGFLLDDLEFEQSGYVFFLSGNLYQISYESPEGESKAYGYNNIQTRSEHASTSTSNYQIISDLGNEGCTLKVSTLNLMTKDGKIIPNWMHSVDGKSKDPGLTIAGRTILSGSILRGSNALFSISVPADKCIKRYKFSDNRGTFRQELIYLGRSGDELSFKYREFSKNLARPAFSADLKYDLSESQTIGYRGARIKIIEAGNQLLKYRVERHIKDI